LPLELHHLMPLSGVSRFAPFLIDVDFFFLLPIHSLPRMHARLDCSREARPGKLEGRNNVFVERRISSPVKSDLPPPTIQAGIWWHHCSARQSIINTIRKEVLSMPRKPSR
jgi:hypothetical protein